MKLPDHLVVYLSRKCNLACGYCYAGPSSPAVIKEKDLLSSIDIFAKLPGKGKKITFLGGEPLLHTDLLKKAVIKIRRALPAGTPVKVFTNGTLLTPPLRRFFAEHGVKVVLSLDGGKSLNDSFRKFKNSSASVFEAAIKKLRGNMDGVTVSMVAGPGSLPVLVENIAKLRGLGFKSIAWSPDISARWTEKDIVRLKKALLEIKAWYLGLIKKGEELYEMANIYEILAEAEGRAAVGPCSSLTLAPDGYFYPCDKLIAAAPAELSPFRMEIKNGRLDMAPRRLFFARAAASGLSSGQLMCPLAPWTLDTYVRKSPCSLSDLKIRAKLTQTLVDGYRALIAIAQKFPGFRKLHNLDV